jgi:hypothetical protein
MYFVAKCQLLGMILAWKAMVAITMPTTINVPRVSSIQFPWCFQCLLNDKRTHSHHLLNLERARCAPSTPIPLSTSGTEEFRSVDLLTLTSFIMFWISKHLKSLGLADVCFNEYSQAHESFAI